jgi:hypothetical protein
MHHKITLTSPPNRADLDYIKAQCAQVGPDARIKLRGACGETNWMSLTEAQTLAVEEALKPDATPPAFNPITVSITCHSEGDALLLWLALGHSNATTMALAERHLTPEQQELVRTALQRRYGGLFNCWDALDNTMKLEKIIAA